VRAYGTDDGGGSAPTAYFSRTVPYESRPLWLAWLRRSDAQARLGLPPGGGFTADDYTRLAGRACAGCAQLPFPLPDAAPAPLRAEWDRFIRTAYPRRLLRVRVTPELDEAYRRYVAGVCRTPAAYMRLTGQALPDAVRGFAGLRLPPYENSTLWRNFIPQVPLAQLEILSAEQAWQAFLRARYGTVQAVNAAYGWQLAALDEARFPTREALAVTFVRRGWRDFFIGALRELSHGGRVSLPARPSVRQHCPAGAALGARHADCQSLAAYALSRFGLRSAEKILLFLLATMAFPAAVTAIPGFLLIRDLGLLNTFAALVLPTLASGMSIFILKGFFDGLPRELYEAAAIDGAKEWQIFLRITLPMTTPILAVNALNAFVHAYNSWEWALLVCQRQSHWTLAVWMYQMSQQLADQPWAVMAGFVLVSIPTAVVFIACQKIILRGIVLPSMK
jgi:multiple sugar transport system permease protein